MPFGGLLTVGLLGLGGTIAGGIIGSNAAGRAADTQASAADRAAQLQADAQQKALDFQKEVFAKQQENQAPFLAAGTGAVGQLSDMLKPGGELYQNWTGSFAPPTDVTEQNDPGFQFRLAEGQKALERSAAARGNLLTGGTGKALLRYGQELGSNEYQNVYNRRLQEYQQAYNEFNNNQTNRFNRLASLSGLGQTSATNINSAGSNAAGTNANILLGGANAQGNYLTNAAAARASGYVGGANSLGGAISSGAGQIGNLVLLNSLLNPGGGSSTVNVPTPGYFGGYG